MQARRYALPAVTVALLLAIWAALYNALVDDTCKYWLNEPEVVMMATTTIVVHQGAMNTMDLAHDQFDDNHTEWAKLVEFTLVSTQVNIDAKVVFAVVGKEIVDGEDRTIRLYFDENDAPATIDEIRSINPCTTDVGKQTIYVSSFFFAGAGVGLLAFALVVVGILAYHCMKRLRGGGAAVYTQIE